MMDVLNLIIDWLTLSVGVCSIVMGMLCGINGTSTDYAATSMILAGCLAVTIWHRRCDNA